MTTRWTQARLQKYIDNKVEESLTLDYKAGDALSKSYLKRSEKVTIDVSAMANSAGGIIIYGLAEGKTSATKHLATKFKPVNRTETSKETLEHMVGSIRPKIDEVIIHSVSINTGSNDVAYVVVIPQANTAHQALDKRYYKRHNFESAPMYDYEIRDVMRRGKSPKIELTFKIIRIPPPVPTSHPEANTLGNTNANKRIRSVEEYFLEVTGENTGTIYAKYIVLYIDVPGIMSQEYREYEDADSDSSYHTFKANNRLGNDPSSPRPYDPLLPYLTRRWKFRLRSELDLANLHTLEIRWAVLADNAPPVTGKVAVGDIEVVDKDFNYRYRD